MTIGIIANPASGKDVRRLVAQGSVFDTSEKTNIPRRVLRAIDALGGGPVPIVPDPDALGARAQQPARPGESRTGPTKCFDAREVGVIQLGTGEYDVTVSVLPHSSFGQTTRLTLRSLDPSSVPSVPGSPVTRVVFALDAQSSCDGAAIGTLPYLVNLGITYNAVPAVDKARLQIARLEGGSWVNVDTVPDPVAGNPYVSTTIGTAGTYALVQR